MLRIICVCGFAMSKRGSSEGHRPKRPGRPALAFACVLAAGCATQAAAPGSAGTAFGEARVERRDVEDVFLISGEIRAVRSLDIITPRTDAWRIQLKWLAEDGAEVAEGDRLVEFDNAAVSSRLEERRLAWIQSEIDLESRAAVLEADREDRKLTLDRALSEAEKARMQAEIPKELRSAREWQDAQAALRRAVAEVEKARLGVESFETASESELQMLRLKRDKAAREIERTRRMLDQTSIRAEKSGIFIVGDNRREGRKFRVADTCWPGMTVGSIPDLSEMEVRAWLSDVDDGRIAAGMTARAILDTYPDRVFEGRVRNVSALPSAEQGFEVLVALDDPDADLMRPGMSVRVEILRSLWRDALTLPRGAVLFEDGSAWAVTPGGSEPVEIRVASCTPLECILHPEGGEDGAIGLNEGQRVLLR